MSIPPQPCSIPPELFPSIASFVPLRSVNKTLLSLALGNHHFYAIIRPLLYLRLVLGNEEVAISVIQKILNEPQLGIAVTEIHIMADLSVETREREKPFDVLDGLQLLIRGKLLPRLAVLGISLMNGWNYDEGWNVIPISSHGRLLEDFWKTLRIECPRLKSVSLRNLGHDDIDPYLSGNVIDQILGIPGLSVLRLEWIGQGLSKTDYLKVVHKLPDLAASLHTLSLKISLEEIAQFVSITFPHLKWLRLDRFLTYCDMPKIMTFFREHPQLESLELIGCSGQWFSDGINEGFLPNLKHLKARFEDIRRLSCILPQLVSLSFTESSNCQVPYLLRAVIRNGLPQLRSLEIEQCGAGWEDCAVEGVLWYETTDGQFCIEKKRKNVIRFFTDNYIHSIVRGAPNLEELGLHGMNLWHEDMEALGPVFAQFKNLKRLYYRRFSMIPRQGTPASKEKLDTLTSDFIRDAEILARLCKCLQRVTNISGTYMPHLSVVFERDPSGAVVGAKRDDGTGMEIPAQDNDPFPYT